MGSEVFNQLIICAGAVYSCKSCYIYSFFLFFPFSPTVIHVPSHNQITVFSSLLRYKKCEAKTGTLQLNKAIVTREVGFYALSIGLLYYALQDHRPLDTDPNGPDHIFISFHQSCFVFAGYIAYVLVCANMESIVDFFTKRGRDIRDGLRGEQVTYGAIGKSAKKVRCFPVFLYYDNFAFPTLKEGKNMCRMLLKIKANNVVLILLFISRL